MTVTALARSGLPARTRARGVGRLETQGVEDFAARAAPIAGSGGRDRRGGCHKGPDLEDAAIDRPGAAKDGVCADGPALQLDRAGPLDVGRDQVVGGCGRRSARAGHIIDIVVVRVIRVVLLDFVLQREYVRG